MKSLKVGLNLSLVLALVVGSGLSCGAAENDVGDIFARGASGGLAGNLVGGALLAITHNTSENHDYLGYADQAGVLAGMTFGLVKKARALAHIDKGHVSFALPTVIPELRTASGGGNTVAFRTELISGRF
jgi:hypothetical protein